MGPFQINSLGGQLSHLDDRMILKPLLLCSLFILSASQEDDDAGGLSASHPISSEEYQASEDDSSSETKTLEIFLKGGNQTRSSWPWCYNSGCPVDIDSQCCSFSYCQRTTWQKNWCWHYYLAASAWSVRVRTEYLQEISPAFNNHLLNFAATYSTVTVTVTLYHWTPYGWGSTQTLIAAHITPAEAAQIRNANCHFISYQPHAVASSADLARYCLRGRGHHRAWVTVASWQLKWCITTVGNNHRMLRSNTYGMCCYIPRYGERAAECYWTKSI